MKLHKHTVETHDVMIVGPEDAVLEYRRYVAAPYRLLIDLSSWRHCPVCAQKIDRGVPPRGGMGYGPDDLWPYWHCHASNCDLRIAAEAMGLPAAVSKPTPPPAPSASSRPKPR